MTATLAPTSQAVSEWVKIFPRQVTENYTSSVTFMKQLTVVAISTITYLKNAFPEDSYMVETFGGIKLRILKKKCRDELAQFLSTALTQAFEAFDKKYLHQLALCFYEDECKIDNLIEYHIFEYSYHDAGVTMNVHSKGRDSAKRSAQYTFENVKERTIHLIRACVVIMESCQNDLPSTYDVSLRLYYNEEAPLDYQAPGFQSSEGEHLQASLADSVKLGWVETPFHKLLARSYIKDTFGASHEAIASQNAPMLSQPALDSSVDLSGRRSTCNEIRLRCPCNKYESEEPSQPVLLTCQYCQTNQHAACFGILYEHVSRVGQHCCASCADADPTRVPTDPKLASLSVKKRECLCIFRRALEWCSSVSAVECKALGIKFGVSPTNAAKLLKLLQSHGVVSHHPDSDLNTPQKIIPENLKSVIGKFFQTTAEENIVDRLLAETFASQESHSDPITEVLTPLEKVSLQNASNIGRVIDNPDTVGFSDRHVEDATLKQYREAILSSDTPEELANVTEELGKGLGVQRKTAKRKVDEGRIENRFGLRSGVRTKRAKALPK